MTSKLREPDFPETDVVIVSYNSSETLRSCVEPLSQIEALRVIVVDNASSDDSVATIADLDVERVALSTNRGFAAGCNEGMRAGKAPFVLFLNPDAHVDRTSLQALALGLRDSHVALVAPRIEDAEGVLERSQRRFPRLRSTYAQALFAHRILPEAGWVDEIVRDDAAYEKIGMPEWVSGACVLVRRSVLEEIGGWDESFFMYCEDIDLCQRIRSAGFEILFEPSARVVHLGGASKPRAALLPVLARSRILYAQKHRSRAAALAERLGIGISALTHLPVSPPSRARGHARSLAVVAGAKGSLPA